MTKARQDFIDHLKLRGFSNCTIDNYIENISLFARFFNKAPDLLGNDHVKQYQLHLHNKRMCYLRRVYTFKFNFYKEFTVRQ